MEIFGKAGETDFKAKFPGTIIGVKQGAELIAFAMFRELSLLLPLWNGWSTPASYSLSKSHLGASEWWRTTRLLAIFVAGFTLLSF